MFSDRDYYWMREALLLAKKAESLGEVPVAAILVLNDELISVGLNQPIGKNDPTAHAEMEALRAGAKKINNYRLIETTLYVTLEPCLMCASAIVHARVKRVVYAAFDSKTGSVSSQFKAFDQPFHNHKVEAYGGLLQEEAGLLLSQFFQKRRKEKCAQK